MFRTFLQAGFECSTHKLRTGRRLDVVAATRHDEFVNEDYARLGNFGIGTVREGIRWTLIEPQPGELSFASVRPFLEAARRNDIEVIWDVLHFGWPDYLDIFEPSWQTAFERLARAFGRFLRDAADPPWRVAPVNEISFMAWAGGDVEYLNPFARGRGPELKACLVKAFIAAARALREELPGVTLISPEPAIHIKGRPDVPGDEAAAEGYRQSMFEAWDMILGRSNPELGGSEDLIDVIGVNFYDRNQWWNFGQTIWRRDAAYRPFSEILKEIADRYRRPLFVSETGTEGEDRPAWFRYIADEVHAALDSQVPVNGICLYPILDHPGWDDDRYCPNGLWGYADDSGARNVCEPLAAELQKSLFRRE
jgi:hypothetical protein